MTSRPAPATGLLQQRIAAGSRRPASLGSTPAGAISLAIGEPFADTNPAIVQAAVDAVGRC